VTRFLKLLDEQDRWSLIILSIVVVLFFLPFFTASNILVWSYSHLGSDIDYRHWPDLTRYAASLREGKLALWDPLIALGRPLAGDPGVLFGYPFIILFVFLPPTLAFNVYDALHVFIAGMAMFLFLQKGYYLSRPASLIGGMAFAFAPKLIAHLASGHVGVIAGVAWSPLVWLGLKRSFDGSYIAAALAGGVMAMQLPTHVQMPYYTAGIASAFWLWHLVPQLWRKQWNQVRHLLAVYAIWLIAFLLLAAYLIIPFLEIVRYNSRASFSLEDANVFALMPSLLLTLLTPTLNFRLHEWTIYLGVLPPLLALVGILTSPHKVKGLFAALAIFALIFALGTATPLFELAFYFLPGFQFFRVPTRLWFFGGAAAIILAGFGAQALDDDLKRIARRHQWRLLQLAGVYVIGGGVALIAYVALFGQWHVYLAMQLALLLLLVVLVWAWLNDRLNSDHLRWLLVPLLLFDLLPVSKSYINQIDPQKTFLRSTPELDFVSRQNDIFRVYSPQGDQPYAAAAEKNVEFLDGLLAFQIGHAVKAIRESSGCNNVRYATSIPPCLDDVTPTASPNAELLGRLNVRYVINPHLLSDPNFKLVMRDKEYVYENLLWLPRARLGGKGRAEILKREAGDYEIAVNVEEASQLIVSETWLPGWRATSAGRELSVTQAEGALIGVAVSPSDTLIRLRYDPLGWQIGWRVSLIAWIVLGTWILFAFLNPQSKPQSQTK